MMRDTIKLLVVGVILVTFAPMAHAQNTKAETPPNDSPSEDKLIERFYRDLELELGSDKISFSFGASRDLNKIIQDSARKIIEDKAFDRLTEADENFRSLGEGLRERGEKRGDQVLITNATLFKVMIGHAPNQPGLKGLCPLFPFCK